MNRRLVILDVFAKPLYIVMLAASVVVLLRGHNEPGGGFIAGLVAVSATVLWALAHGSGAAGKRLPFRSPLRLAAIGVATALASGLPALLMGEAFLTHLWGRLPLGLTDLKLSTVLVFDVGVYLAVWGSLAGYALTLLAADGDAEEGP
jgi:multicomponent Na+:H+ antiporter subunit B